MKRMFIAACSCLLLAGCSSPAKEAQQSAQTTAASASTSSAESPAQTATEDVFVDHDGIKITSSGFEITDRFAAIKIEIDNQSEQEIVVQTRDFSVNGYMCRAALSQKVLPGKKANANIRIFDDELSKNGMKKEDVKDVEFKIDISTPDYDEIFQSDVISRHYE